MKKMYKIFMPNSPFACEYYADKDEAIREAKQWAKSEKKTVYLEKVRVEEFCK